MNKKTLAKGELIGRRVKIKNCDDPTWENRVGVIVDETKNTFLIENEETNEVKRIAKKIASFEFKNNDDKTVVIDGQKIIYRPEDRIKKC
ncbi:MAG: ribonuclease P protein subunit [Candidatus Thermoplasmatota archaeon]